MGENYILAPAGKLTSSYRAEQIAFKTGLEWLQLNVEFVEGKRIHIFSDSKSLVNKLQKGPQVAKSEAEVEIWKLIAANSEITTEIHIQWIPGHANLHANETADRTAKLATKLEQKDQPIDISTAKSNIKSHFVNEWKKSIKRNGMPLAGKAPPSQKEQSLNRKERIISSQLRAGGNCPILRSYQKRINKRVNKYVFLFHDVVRMYTHLKEIQYIIRRLNVYNT